MDPSEEVELEKGFMWAHTALTTADPDEFQQALNNAVNTFVPLAAPERHIPKAAFSLGLFAHQLAQVVAGNPNLKNDDCAKLIKDLREISIRYIEIAAGMEDYQNDFTPARAKDTLAQFHESGLVGDGEPNLAMAYSLRLEAAMAGYAEAQINLAIMCYRGEGTEPSVFQAKIWAEKAVRNKDQLSPARQKDAFDILEALCNEFSQSPEPPVAAPTNKLALI